MTYNHRILAALALTGILSAGTWAATTNSSFAKTSRLSSGHWVKVRVDGNAVYAIDDATLRQWGFDDPEAVKVYGYSGVEHHADIASLMPVDREVSLSPDDLPMAPWMRADGRLIFYGEGCRRQLLTPAFNAPDSLVTVRDTHSTAEYYFLSDVPTTDKSPVKAATVQTGAANTTLTTHRAVDFRHPEEYAPLYQSAYLFSYPIAAGTPREFTFGMPGYAGRASISYRYAGAQLNLSRLPLTPPDNVTLDERGGRELSSTLKGLDDHGYFQMSDRGVYPFAPTGPTSEAYTFGLGCPNGYPGSFLSAFQVYLTYDRHNDISGCGQLDMQYPGLKQATPISLSGTSEATKLWDVTDPRNVVQYALQDQGNGVRSAVLPASERGRYVAFNTNGDLPTPVLVGDVPNQSLHSMDGNVEMVIVTSQTCLDAAQRLAKLHTDSYQKMKIAVVPQEQIFNEFSSGAVSAEGVRKFLQMNYLRGNKKLKYALMFGAGINDNRGTFQDSLGDYLVTYINDLPKVATKETAGYASDMFYGMLDPQRETSTGRCKNDLAQGKVPVSISVGRIPARTRQEADICVDKIERYFRHPELAGEFTSALLIGDLSDKNGHVTSGVEPSADSLRRNMPAAPTIYRAYQELHQTAELMNSALDGYLSQPVSLMMYSGHANPNNMGMRIFVDYGQESTWTYGSMPITFLSACSPLDIDQYKRGLGMQMFLNKNNGPIAVCGAHRTVLMSQNNTFEHDFASRYAKLEHGDRLGDLWLASFNRMITSNTSSSGLRTNTLCYSLVGDPAIPIYAPIYRLILDSVDNKFHNPNLQLTPGKMTRLRGRVVNTRGEKRSFTGVLTVKLFDAPYDAKLGEYHAGDQGLSTVVTLDQTLLATATAEVNNGEWQIDFRVPEAPTPKPRAETDTINMAPTYRLSLLAHNITNTDFLSLQPLSAVGSAVFTMSDETANDSYNDSQPPVISTMELEGGEVLDDKDVVLNVTVTDNGSGLNLTSLQGASPRLTLDGKVLASVGPRFRVTGKGMYSLRYPINGLDDGRHTLDLTVADQAGNQTQRQLSFIVDTNPGSATLALDRAIARTEIQINLTHTLNPTLFTPNTTLLVCDSKGNTVKRIQDATYPLTLDVTDMENGDYTVSALLRAADRYLDAAPLTFTVVKKSK